MKIFHVGSHQLRESLQELLRELRFSYYSSRGMPFRERNFVFREWDFEFRELLREYPGTLRELREWPFHSESVFPEIGVVPRLLNPPLPPLSISDALSETLSQSRGCSLRLYLSLSISDSFSLSLSDSSLSPDNPYIPH